MSNRFEFKTEADITTFLRALATALGEGWEVGKIVGTHYAELRRGGEGIIYISTQYGDPKLRIGGHFPRHSDVASPNGHHIGVTPTRPVAEIAKEIQRRLLPDFLAAREDYLEKVRAFEQNKADDLTLARKLAALAGTKLQTEHHDRSIELPTFLTKGYSARVRVSYGKVQFDQVSSLTPDVAERVIKALNTYKGS